jgi:hypothetical protein
MSSDAPLEANTVLPAKASTSQPDLLNTLEPLSPQDKVNLYEVLQILAQALRRIRYEDNQAPKQQQ